MRSVLITGGTGSFGLAFAKHCLAQGVQRVCIYSRGEHRQAEMRAELGDRHELRWFIGDVRDANRLRRAMNGIEVVVHAAALKRIEVGQYNPTELVLTNVGGALNVVDAATSAGVRRVVALSTDKACAPVNAYGSSKLLAEKLFLAENNARGAFGPQFVVTRYGNVAGSAGSVIPIWRALLKTGHKHVPVTDPECTRFWMTLEQAVDMVWKAATEENVPMDDVITPDLPAYRLADLALALNAEMRVLGLPVYEKRHEAMTPEKTSDQARRMSVEEIREALRHV